MLEPPSSKNTKAQILEAYNALLKEHNNLKADVAQLQREKSAAEKQAAKAAKEAAAAGLTKETPQEDKKAVQKKQFLSIEQIIQSISALQTGFGSAVSELSEKLTAEAARLHDLRRTIADEKQQLEKLHGLEITNTTLVDLLNEYSEKARAFDEEFQQKQDVFEQELTETKRAWQKEQEEHALVIKERNESQEIALQREEAEYKYNLELQRKLDNEQYALQQKQLMKALDKIQENAKNEQAGRETKIAEWEKEYNDLKTKVESFESDLEKAIKKAKEEAKAEASEKAKVQTDLRAKEEEGQRRVFELKIESLQETLERQIQQGQHLSAQLEATSKQAQELATKAIEGASNVSSFRAMKEIALQQAKNVQKNQ